MNVKPLPVVFMLLCSISCLYGQKLYLRIAGNDSLETLELKTIAFNNIHENIISVYDETAIIQHMLYRKGYFRSTVDTLIRKDSICNAYFSLGKKIDRIKAKVDPAHISIIKDAGVEVINDSVILTPETYEAALEGISGQFEARGDPFSEITLSNMETTGHVLRGTLSVSETIMRKLDSIVVKGYDKFSPDIVKRISNIKPGELFNRAAIVKKTEALDQLPYINRIKPPEVLFSKDATQLYIYIEKTNANYFDGFIGFATDEETRKLRLNGYLDVRLLNNLNSGEQLTLSWKNNGSQQRIFNADAEIPYLFRSAFGARATLHIIKQDSTFTTTTATASANYGFTANATAGLGIETAESAGLLSTAPGGFGISDYTSFFVTASYNYHLRNKDSPVFNEKLKLNLTIATGNRKITSTGSRQQKFYSDISYQWHLNYKNRIYVRNLTELLLSEDYLYNEKYRFGGINSVRGFNENSLEATFYNVVNTEYRLLLSKTLYLHSIFDVAYIEDRLLEAETVLYGFGLGLGAITPGGFLKINYAIGKSENTVIRFADAKIHLSFSAFF